MIPLPRTLASPSPAPKALGQILLEHGTLNPADLVNALAQEGKRGARLREVLLRQGMVTEPALVDALADQWQADVADPASHPADPRMIDAFGLQTCLREGILPWRSAGGVTIVLTARPEEFIRHRMRLTELFGPVCMAVATESQIHAAILAVRRHDLNRRAESRPAPEFSCRNWPARPVQMVVLALVLLAVLLAVIAPKVLFAGLVFWALGSLVLVSAVKAASAVAHLRRQPTPVHPAPIIARMPVVSVMVPLYREPDIAPRLVRRLGRLTYPKELLDVLLVVEEEDDLTRSALAARTLPAWMRVVVVPQGPLKTKPRALNFALEFCRGTIIGVYDAEDAPEPDQIHRIVRRFHERGPELACVQGVLDYYNPDTNWLARCFAIEYAAWFRVVLPGMERLGLCLPLGGTTLFFRRSVLEELGAWDAHNVTEDADLGIRLARQGYRTEVLPTVTGEEANCRLVPWVKQRSRWLKGYAMTYIVHMRNPRQLLREIGPWRFFGLQVLFGATLSQFLLAPVLWVFWLLALGFGPAISDVVPIIPGMAALFLLTEAINMTIGAIAVSGPRHRFLWRWVITMPLYFPLATLAAYKALRELMVNPYYWDKTAHGIFDIAQVPRRRIN